MFPLARSTGIGDGINLQPVNPTLGCVNQQVGMCGRYHQMLHHIFTAGPHSNATLPATGLTTIGIHGGALQVSATAYSHRDVFHLHQIF